MKCVFQAALLAASALSSPAIAQQHDHGAMQMDPPPAPQPLPQIPPATPSTADPKAVQTPQPQVTAKDQDAPKQDHSMHGGHQGHNMPGMQGKKSEGASGGKMAGMDDGSTREIMTCQPGIPSHGNGSGTSRLPGIEESYHHRYMRSSCPSVITGRNDWMFMQHGTASLQYTDHKGPRGDDMAYVTSMAMLSADRDTDWGHLQFKGMLSLEPLMDASGYPNLFATGETAHGLPIVDRQHPHDLFMELTARIDVNVGPGSLFLYGGPVGEPALGPSAFVHRKSSAYNPEPPVTHHWFDSTHITYGVVTAGYSAPVWQIEASAFRGAEPDERRWNIETPKLDSWSVRGTLTPSRNWAIQASYGKIKQPESTHPDEDENRFTASAHYASYKVSAMLAYSAKKRVPGDTLSAWLAEANWNIDDHNTLFGRIENVANDELFPDHHDPLHDVKFRISKFQAGYARRIPLGPVELALGGSVSAYARPAALAAAYGKPWGYTLFARITLGQ